MLVRDLEKLRQEINAYNSEAVIWKTEKAISNSAGNLCLHLVGNLSYFIGTVLGNTGYIRNRENEFTSKDIPKAELIQQIDSTIGVVKNTFMDLKEESLYSEYPQKVFEQQMTTGHFVVHLSTHLGYHLGQVNYHRRLLDS